MFHRQPARTFEDRVLARQSEDIEDQGLAFDLGTVVSRRRLLGIFGLGAGAAALAACAPGASTSAGTTTSTSSTSAPATLTEMNTETAGPYPGDGSNGPDVLEISGVERSDIRGSIDGGATAAGVPMTLRMNLIDMAGGNVPMVGAAVYVWHCDGQGRYSMYDEALSGETYLRGVQISDDAGQVTFTSIIPGCYQGRWPHIHFEVFPDRNSITEAGNNILTSQIALPEETCAATYSGADYEGSTANLAGITLDSDNVFNDGWQQQMPAVSGDQTVGFQVTIDIPIDTTTEQVNGGPGGGMGEPPEGMAPPRGGAPGER